MCSPAIYALNKALHLTPRKFTLRNHNESIRPTRFYTARVIFNVSHPCGNGLIQLNNRKAEGIQRLRRRAKSGPSGISALRP